MGGLGFQDLEAFNLALLGKQLWRMATYKDSLLARIFKSQYFAKSDPFSATLGSRPSYAWRSIFAAQKLMKQGVRVVIGNGQQTNAWQEQWMQSKPAKGIQEMRLEQDSGSCLYSNNMRVGELLIAGTSEWNRPLIRKMFTDEIVKQIEKIRPGGIHRNDTYAWDYTKSGFYSVKSGYWVQKNVLERALSQIQVSQPSIDSLYQAIWRTKTNPKIHHFLWKCLSDSLPTAANMQYRHIVKEGSCPRCEDSSESINHMLFQCPLARLVWALSPISDPKGGVLAHTIYSNLHHVLQNKQDGSLGEERLEIGPWILWKLWKNRNELVYHGKEYDGASIVAKAMEDAREWRLRNEEKAKAVKVPATSTISVFWQPSKDQWIKCNVDGSWHQNAEGAGLGWLSRDTSGKLIWAGARKIQGVSSAIEAEAEAMRWAVVTMANFGYKKVIMESDSQVLISLMRGDEDVWLKLQPIIEEIIHTLKRTSEFVVKYQVREVNKAADRIRKEVFSYENHVPKLYSIAPVWLKSVVEADKPSV